MTEKLKNLSRRDVIKMGGMKINGTRMRANRSLR
jgi:hypothetical protein